MFVKTDDTIYSEQETDSSLQNGTVRYTKLAIHHMGKHHQLFKLKGHTCSNYLLSST